MKKKLTIALQFAAVPPEAAGEVDAQANWVQVAYEGQFMGYRGGDQPFAFTRQHFEQAVANLHANAAFVLGENGEGSTGVIPWDFNHASELNPSEGALPVMGAPAQGWTFDLQVRTGEDGKAQLWALTAFQEPARGYVKNGQYAWASVSAIFEATDGVTGENIGMILTSIALTNTPFLEGMERLVASHAGRYFDTADSAEDALESLRQLLVLPATTDAAGVMGEIGKLAQWIAGGGAPLGVDVSDLLGGMRRILGLQALATEQEVLDNASQIIQRLISEQVAGTEPAAPIGAPLEDDPMLKKLAALLGVTESDSAVEGAVAQLAQVREGLIKLFALEAHAGSRVVLEAAEASVDARGKLASILKALGVEDTDAGVDQIATLITQAEELKAAMPELEGLRAKTKVAEAEKAEVEVTEAMASYGIPDAAKEALLLSRANDPAKFALKFPKKEATAAAGGVTPAPAVLTSVMATGPTGDRIAPAAAGDINLDEFPGRNPTERAYAYLALNHAGWDKLPDEHKFKLAVSLKRRDDVKFTPIQAVAG